MFESIEKPSRFPKGERIYVKQRLYAVVPHFAGFICWFLGAEVLRTPPSLRYGLYIAAVVFWAVAAVVYVRLERALKKYRLTGEIE
jgi:hypothetical protein